jgi:hypothetical protein
MATNQKATYPAIPQPFLNNPTSVWAAVVALKAAFEILIGLRGSGAALFSTTSTGTSTTSTSGLTQSQVLARVSLGV